MSVFVFPGQGAQHRGMGRELFDRFPEVVDEASEVLGYCLRTLCLEDPENRLGDTRYTQPALFVVNALACRARGRRPDAAAGLSLGEFNALLAAEVFDFRTGLALVQKRGEIMARVTGGGMAAVIGLAPWRVEEVLADERFGALDVANYNSFEQTVISGPRDALAPAARALEDAGAQRVSILDVSAPFHSRYMKDAAREFAAVLDACPFAPPTFPVISNATALPHRHGHVARDLARQIDGPVRWIESIEHLLREGHTEFEEVGPGRTLTRLVGQIRDASAFLGVPR